MDDELEMLADDMLNRVALLAQKFECPYADICSECYDTKLCSENYCQFLLDMKDKMAPEEIKKRIAERANITPTVRRGVELVCPRSIRYHTTIVKHCDNEECQFYAKNMAFRCVLLHGKAFFPDSSVPVRVKEVATGIPEVRLKEYMNLSIALMRVYLILFKYGVENLKMEYKMGEFQTKFIYKFLLCMNVLIDVCPRCGAVVTKDKKRKLRIKNSDDYFFQDEFLCSCADEETYNKRMELIKLWKDMLKVDGYDDSLLTCSYREFEEKAGHDIGKPQFTRFMLSKFNFDGLYLHQVPIGYVFRAYHMLFGKINPANFGMSKKLISMFVNNFDPESGE